MMRPSRGAVKHEGMPREWPLHESAATRTDVDGRYLTLVPGDATHCHCPLRQTPVSVQRVFRLRSSPL